MTRMAQNRTPLSVRFCSIATRTPNGPDLGISRPRGVRTAQRRYAQRHAAAHSCAGGRLEGQDRWGETPQTYPAMILVDTPVIVAWLDPRHPSHDACWRALDGCAAVDELAVSVVTLCELAAMGCSAKLLGEDLRGFTRLSLDAELALRAGSAFAREDTKRKASLLQFLIWSQAAASKLPLLVLRAPKGWAAREVDFLVPALGRNQSESHRAPLETGRVTPQPRAASAGKVGR